MINKDRLIKDCLATKGWPYSSPGSNDENGIDCSGMLVRAFKLQGASIYHGSNRIIRAHCSLWRSVSGANSLEAGMAVFKCRDDGQEGNEYKLGGKYYNPKLIGNFYHVGVVASVHPLQIIHCTDPVSTVDTRVGSWAMAAYLKNVAYVTDVSIKDAAEDAADVGTHAANAQTSAENSTKWADAYAVLAAPQSDSTPQKWFHAAVVIPDGGRLNLRRAPTTAVDNRVGFVPNGAQVIVLETRSAGWAKVRYMGVDAYAQTQFLLPITT